MADDTATTTRNDDALVILQRLDETIKALNQQSPSSLSHYRQLPDDVEYAYQLLDQSSTQLSATATKYTLMGKINKQALDIYVNDLIRACQGLATACLIVCDNNNDNDNDNSSRAGCATALKQAVTHTCRSIFHAVVQLITSFNDDTAFNDNTAAQRTGAIWQACEAVPKLPRGNRNALRRQWLTFLAECNETMKEFQDIIDLGPQSTSTSSNGQQEAQSWDDFLQGQADPYSELELPIAVACVALVKCSRGSIKATLQAADCMDDSTSSSHFLEWLGKLERLALQVGNGMTDLGATLYAPLDLAAVAVEVTRQNQAIEDILSHILHSWEDATLDQPTALLELATNVRAAAQKRKEEALEAIARAQL